MDEETLTECPWSPKQIACITDSPEQVLLIIDMLLQLGERTVKIMQHAADDAHAGQWRHAAHGLAGAALNLGMERLAVHCREDVQSTASEQQRTMLRENIRAELQRIAAYERSLEH